MRIRRSLLLALISALSIGACRAQAAHDAAADEAAVRAADMALQQAVAARDADRTASSYAIDATLLPVAEPIVEGREAIRREWAKVFGIPGFANTARLTKVELSGGDLAYTQGTYESVMTGANNQSTTERGKFVTVWRRQPDGSWKVVTDIFNTDAPPPLHQESTHSERRP